jgi:hypothetical protein
MRLATHPLSSIGKLLGDGKMLGTILLVVLILMLVGSVPAHPYSAGWGYYPSGIIGTVLLVFVILLLLGRV